MRRKKITRQTTILSLLIALTLLVYWQCLSFEFVMWDDTWVIEDNLLLRSLSASNIISIFTEFKKFQPVVDLSYALEYHFFGLRASVFHATNIFFHVCNVLLVFVFINKLSYNRTVAILCAALFALHPLKVESVAWASERKDVLYAFFLLLSLIHYIKYMKSQFPIPNSQFPIPKSQFPIPKSQFPIPNSQFLNPNSQFLNPKSQFQFSNYLLCIVFFLLSHLSKVMAASTVFFMILIDYYSKRPFSKRMILEKIPFCIISIAFGLISLFGVHSEAVEKLNESFSFLEKIQYSGYSFLWYFHKFLLPFNLCTYYEYPNYHPGDLPFWFWSYPIAVLFITAIIIYLARYCRELLFGFGFYAASIVFTLQFYAYNETTVADRYFYVSGIGISYIFGFYIVKFAAASKLAAKALVPVTVSIILILSLLTSRKIEAWKNSESLFSDVLDKYPNTTHALLYRSISRTKSGERSLAIDDLNRAIEINPGFFVGYNNRGKLKASMGDTVGAFDDFSLSITQNPAYFDGYNNRAVINLGLGNYQNAISDAAKAISIDPQNHVGYNTRAIIKKRMNDFNGAVDDYSMAIKLNPGYASGYYNRGIIFFELKDYGSALKDFNAALSIDTGYRKAYLNRAITKIITGDTTGACADFKQAKEFALIKKYCR